MPSNIQNDNSPQPQPLCPHNPGNTGWQERLAKWNAEAAVAVAHSRVSSSIGTRPVHPAWIAESPLRHLLPSSCVARDPRDDESWIPSAVPAMNAQRTKTLSLPHANAISAISGTSSGSCAVSIAGGRAVGHVSSDGDLGMALFLWFGLESNMVLTL